MNATGRNLGYVPILLCIVIVGGYLFIPGRGGLFLLGSLLVASLLIVLASWDRIRTQLQSVEAPRLYRRAITITVAVLLFGPLFPGLVDSARADYVTVDLADTCEDFGKNVCQFIAGEEPSPSETSSSPFVPIEPVEPLPPWPTIYTDAPEPSEPPSISPKSTPTPPTLPTTSVEPPTFTMPTLVVLPTFTAPGLPPVPGIGDEPSVSPVPTPTLDVEPSPIPDPGDLLDVDPTPTVPTKSLDPTAPPPPGSDVPVPEPPIVSGAKYLADQVVLAACETLDQGEETCPPNACDSVDEQCPPSTQPCDYENSIPGTCGNAPPPTDPCYYLQAGVEETECPPSTEPCDYVEEECPPSGEAIFAAVCGDVNADGTSDAADCRSAGENEVDALCEDANDCQPTTDICFDESSSVCIIYRETAAAIEACQTNPESPACAPAAGACIVLDTDETGDCTPADSDPINAQVFAAAQSVLESFNLTWETIWDSQQSVAETREEGEEQAFTFPLGPAPPGQCHNRETGASGGEWSVLLPTDKLEALNPVAGQTGFAFLGKVSLDIIDSGTIIQKVCYVPDTYAEVPETRQNSKDPVAKAQCDIGKTKFVGGVAIMLVAWWPPPKPYAMKIAGGLIFDGASDMQSCKDVEDEGVMTCRGEAQVTYGEYNGYESTIAAVGPVEISAGASGDGEQPLSFPFTYGPTPGYKTGKRACADGMNNTNWEAYFAYQDTWGETAGDGNATLSAVIDPVPATMEQTLWELQEGIFFGEGGNALYVGCETEDCDMRIEISVESCGTQTMLVSPAGVPTYEHTGNLDCTTLHVRVGVGESSSDGTSIPVRLDGRFGGGG